MEAWSHANTTARGRSATSRTRRDTARPFVIILDNAKIHHAKLLREFLAENREDLELVFLSPYSPNLNKIEELWGWFKDSVINNVFFHSREEIQKAM